MKITKEDLKFQQIEAAFRYIVDNKEIYKSNELHDIYEFGVYKGASLEKITKHIDWLFREEFEKYPLIYGFDSFEGLPKEDVNLDVFEKFHEGSYNASNDSSTPVIDIYRKVFYSGLHIIKEDFSNLNRYEAPSTMRPALIVHIDCDIYRSTVDALTWMFNNELIKTGTLIAYDEFSIEDVNGGEELAHNQIMEKYQAKAYEVWHSCYYDKSVGKRVRQSLFEITS